LLYSRWDVRQLRCFVRIAGSLGLPNLADRDGAQPEPAQQSFECQAQDADAILARWHPQPDHHNRTFGFHDCHTRDLSSEKVSLFVSKVDPRLTLLRSEGMGVTVDVCAMRGPGYPPRIGHKPQKLRQLRDIGRNPPPRASSFT
jgi:hypothetical protein